MYISWYYSSCSRGKKKYWAKTTMAKLPFPSNRVPCNLLQPLSFVTELMNSCSYVMSFLRGGTEAFLAAVVSGIAAVLREPWGLVLPGCASSSGCIGAGESTCTDRLNLIQISPVLCHSYSGYGEKCHQLSWPFPSPRNQSIQPGNKSLRGAQAFKQVVWVKHDWDIKLGKISGFWHLVFQSTLEISLVELFLCHEIFHVALDAELGRVLSLTSPEAERQRGCN